MKTRLFVLFFLVNIIRSYGQCSLSVDLKSTNNVICSGNPVTLIATPSAGTPGYSYVWSTGESTSSIIVNKAGTYTVSVKDNTAGCPPVTKSITVTEGVIPPAPNVSNISSCIGSPATVTASGSTGTYQWYDAQTGGNFLASGATYTTPPITQKATFYVETTIDGCSSARSAVTVTPYNVRASGGTTCIGSSVTLTASGAASYIWYDAATGGNQVGSGSTFTTPALTASTKYYVTGINNGCVSERIEADANVFAATPPPTVSGVVTCYGTTATLHATAPSGDLFNWYTAPTGGTSLITSSDFTTPPLTASTTYYVEVTSGKGCVSNRTAVTVTVTPVPETPTAADASTCSGSTATLTASVPSGTLKWYATPTSTTALATGNTYVTPILNASTDFYVETSVGSCVSARKAVHVTVNPSPTAPTAPGQVICSGSVAVLKALGPGGTYSWYSASTGGTLLTTGDTFTTAVLTANKTYYVETSIAGCTSPRTAVLVTVNASPVVSTAANVTICSGSVATLSATGTGTSFEWYDVATGGTPLATTATYITPVLTANATYYVQTIGNGCISPRKAVNVTVNATPAVPVASGQSICAGNTATLTATGTGTLQWFDSATGGTVLATGASYTTPVLTATTNYFVEATSGTCTSARKLVKVTVMSTADQFDYQSSTYCISGGVNPVPAISVAGGTFSATPAGLTISSTTGEIDLATSSVGSYVITYANGCVITTQKMYIVVSPDPNFTYSAPVYCQNSANPSPVFGPLGTAGVFSATPAGLVFKSTKSGVINLTATTPGTYTVTNTINATGGCPSVSASTTVKIEEGVTVVAGPNQTVAIGTPVQLAGSISGAVTTGTWSGGAGMFSNTSDFNAVYTPGAGETSATLILTSANPGTSCGPQSKSVKITFVPKPAAPAAANANICAGDMATLFATQPTSGIYDWFGSATGGSSLATSSTFVTPPLTTTTVYYLQKTINGVASDRTPVTVNVTPIPVAPTVAPVGTVCYGTQATLTATAPGGTYQWYDSPTGGNLLFSGAVYTTQFLTANTSYYVQASSGSCTSPTRTQVDVTVNPLPSVTSAKTGAVCSGTALNYVITADLPGTTFRFSRAAVAGISNAAVTNQPVTLLDETLTNTTGLNVNVNYVITPNLNGCDGVPFNYVVTVYPTPQVTSSATGPDCSGTAVDYTIKFNTTNTPVHWSRAAVAGISNAAVGNQTSSNIQEILVNTTTAPINVDYVFTYGNSNCNNNTFTYTATVNPRVVISSAKGNEVCSGIPFSYAITSQIPTAVFSWSRAAVTGIDNPAASEVSGTIAETLVNTTDKPIAVAYIIDVVSNGCLISPFKYTVTVNPTPATPVANSNSPVCSGNTIKLLTPTLIKGGSYLWKGPNGFTSTLQNPVIKNATTANQGTYTLYILANTCTSVAANVDVLVDALPITNAGPDITTCKTTTAVQLAGSVGGGTTTGVWTSAGTGTFVPSAGALNGQYLPSAQDVAAGSVKLTLASASKDDCSIATDDMTINFQLLPAADAGPDQIICSQATTVTLAGKMLAPYGGTWTSTGTGVFSPSAMQSSDMDPVYLLSPDDKKLSSIKFTLTSNTSDPCYLPSDDMVATFEPPPILDAGPDKFLLKGNTTMLTPVVNNPNVTYSWAPAIGLSNAAIKNPVVTGDADRLYTLTVTDSLGCVASDTVHVRIAPQITLPNTFTPNGDGINDFWDIPGLIIYTDATVDVFDRNGQKVFHSIGYGTPWDGRFNGQPLPFGTYYYIIDTKIQKPVLTGYITIIK